MLCFGRFSRPILTSDMSVGQKIAGDPMIYHITETDKRTNQTRVMAAYSEKEKALDAWRELAWQHVDDAQLWHRVEVQEKGRVFTPSALS